MNDKVYPTVKLAQILLCLEAEDVTANDALVGVGLSRSALSSPATRISLNQLIEFYQNADRLARDRHFAYHAGLRFHVTACGLYGFAVLSSTDFRKMARFMVLFHQLATPCAEISFDEENKSAVWKLVPLPHPQVDARVYKFIVELHFGILLSVLRDVMGPTFAARELHVAYGPPDDAARYQEIFGCKVLFGQPENAFFFDVTWLDQKPALGNDLTYAMTVELCNEMMNKLELHIGLSGKIRRILLVNRMRPMRLDDVARSLDISPRTLRRTLHDKNTSFRELVDELRMGMAIKYLRDTNLTIEDIACTLGFSEAASFRQSFRRWTKTAPNQFRNVAGKTNHWLRV